LNSKLGNYLLQDSPRTGTGDLILSVQAIDPIRIPLPNKNNDNLVSSIEQHVTKIIDHYSKKIDDELNTMIYKLYRLTPQEIQIIENLTPIN